MQTTNFSGTGVETILFNVEHTTGASAEDLGEPAASGLRFIATPAWEGSCITVKSL